MTDVDLKEIEVNPTKDQISKAINKIITYISDSPKGFKDLVLKEGELTDKSFKVIKSFRCPKDDYFTISIEPRLGTDIIGGHIFDVEFYDNGKIVCLMNG
jgi:hypothetical protein